MGASITTWKKLNSGKSSQKIYSSSFMFYHLPFSPARKFSHPRINFSLFFLQLPTFLSPFTIFLLLSLCAFHPSPRPSKWLPTQASFSSSVMAPSHPKVSLPLWCLFLTTAVGSCHPRTSHPCVSWFSECFLGRFRVSCFLENLIKVISPPPQIHKLLNFYVKCQDSTF